MESFLGSRFTKYQFDNQTIIIKFEYNLYPSVTNILKYIDEINDKEFYDDGKYYIIHIQNFEIMDYNLILYYKLKQNIIPSQFDQCDELIIMNIMSYLQPINIKFLMITLNASNRNINYDILFSHLIRINFPLIHKELYEYKKFITKIDYQLVYMDLLKYIYIDDNTGYCEYYHEFINAFLKQKQTLLKFIGERRFRWENGIRDYDNIKDVISFIVFKNIFIGFYNLILENNVIFVNNISWNQLYASIWKFYSCTHTTLFIFPEIQNTEYINSFKNLDWINNNIEFIEQSDVFLDNIYKYINDIQYPVESLYLIIKLLKNININKLFPLILNLYMRDKELFNKAIGIIGADNMKAFCDPQEEYQYKIIKNNL